LWAVREKLQLICLYCSLPSKLAGSFATAFILGMAAVHVWFEAAN
jgi:hypothetical protein